MAKERISATVDPVVAEYLQDDTVNASGVVNRAVKREMGILDADENEVLKLRLEQVREERTDLEARADRKRGLETRLEEDLQESRQEQKSREQEVIEWCLENWSYVPDEVGAGVENQAKKADMDPEELLEEVAERWGENDA